MALEPEHARAWHDAQITELLRQRFERAAFVCIEEEGSVIGFAEASRGLIPGAGSGVAGCLDRIGVCDGATESVAGALLAAVEAWVRVHRGTALTSAVAADDAQGQALRQRLGFHQSRRLVLYSKPVDAPAARAEADRSGEPPDPAVEEAGAEPILAVHQPRGSGHALRTVVHGLLFALGGCALVYTDIWSEHPLYGGVLPIVDVLFVLYVLVLVMAVLYRRRTTPRDPALLLDGAATDGMASLEAQASLGAAMSGSSDAGSRGARDPQRSLEPHKPGPYASGQAASPGAPDFEVVEPATPPCMKRSTEDER